ncbi:MAG TPA: PKD domain-containing protein [Bacteroidia bacterium]
MKTKQLLIIITLGITQYLMAQVPASYSSSTISQAAAADEQTARAFFIQHNFNPKDYDEYMAAWRKEYKNIVQRQNQHTSNVVTSSNLSCTNIDFEQGSMNGWTASTGYNPLFNSSGCCPSLGGSQAITSGGNIDPYGLFPTVCPGGNYSLKLGDSLIGGHADRIEQTFLVNNSNSNYSYKYAVVLEDPGHPPSEQPYFMVEVLDSNGNQVPCTYYEVAAGQGIPGFQNSTVQTDVVFKPWTTVAVDLTPYIGQNVTVRFTAYDCALGGHFGYAYIDGSCMPFFNLQNAVFCSNSNVHLCAPSGFGAYNWNGSGIIGSTGNICATINVAGTYTVQLTTVTGCIIPMTYNVVSAQAPTASFGTNSQSCNGSINYTNTSVGTGLTYAWNFGDGTTSTLTTPVHIYNAISTYTNSLIVHSSNGCSDTAIQVVTIHPKPVAQFIFTDVCAASSVSFTNSSTYSGGSIASKWTFGDGATSIVLSPLHAYANGGNYNVQLVITDPNTCKDSIIKVVNIYNLPVANFSAPAVCLGNNTTFNNTSSVAGSTLSGYVWDFTNDGTIDNTTQNPSSVYPSSGTFTASLQVTSTQGCVSIITNTVIVNPNPVVTFSVTDTCVGTIVSFHNNSTIPNGSNAQSFWSFGDGTTSFLTSPQHSYSSTNTYSVTLTETSNYGCVSSSSQTFAPFPIPIVNFIANSACQLQANTFTNTSSISSGSISSYGWDFTNNGTIDNTTQNPNYTYSQGGNFNCTLHATSNHGCIDSITKVVTVYFNPVANFTAPIACNGIATQFTDGSTTQNGTITAWAWDYTSNGTFDNTAQNPSNVYPSNGTYSVTLQVTSSLGCVSSITNIILVNPKPTVVFSVNNACAGSNFNFHNNSTITNGSIVQSLWNFGDGANSTQITPQHNYITASTYSVMLTETSNYGCVSNLSQTVTAYPKPNANFSANAVCQLQANTFTNTSSISGGSISSYGWDFTSNGTIDNTIQNPSYTYSQGGSFNCTLHAISNDGCVDSITKPITVYFNPVANFNAASVCYSIPVQFNNTSTSQNGIITAWDWDFTSNGTFDNVYENPSNNYASYGLFLITLQVQSSYGCQNIIKKPVRVNATPVADFTVAVQKGCPYDMCVGMINNSTMQGGSLAPWLWNFGDNTTSSQNSPIHCFKTGTFNISLTVVSDSGCKSTATINNAITVYPKPIAGFTYTPQDVDIIDPTVTIENQAEGATTYIYFISDGYVVAGHPTFTHHFVSDVPQNYTVLQAVANSYGCKDSIEHVIVINPGYTFYIPNAFTPNGDGTNEVFKGTGIGIKSYTIMIFDRWGELIFQSDNLEKGWDGTFKGKGGDVVQEGVYVWKIQLRDEKNNEHDFDGTVSVIK